jgi:hypothetical protein
MTHALPQEPQEEPQDRLENRLRESAHRLADRSDGDTVEIAPLHLSQLLRPGADASFALLDGRPTLFSASTQKLYELNQTAAFIWCNLLDNKPAEAICVDLQGSGLDHNEARAYLQAALQNWLTLGLLQIDWGLHEKYAFAVRIGKLTVEVRASHRRLRDLLLPLFSWSAQTTADAEETYDLIDVDGLAYVFHNKTFLAHCTIDALVPTVKASLTEKIVARCAPDVAFHAACLMAHGKALLVSGPPGTGKSTLALHLLEAGFEFGSDDISLIASDGRAVGVPFAPTLKTGAWEIVNKFRPEINNAPVHTRADGLLVRYLETSCPSPHDALPVGWIIFIQRKQEGAAQLKHLAELDTMTRLIEGSYAPDGKMSHQVFHAIRRTLLNAPAFELTYADAADACASLVELCHD